jgi:8-oxo-dGTP diphosphatase
MILLVLNSNKKEPLDYNDRKTVKGVITNDEGKILLFSSNLIGGGVEKGETDKDALHREALEEAGIRIEIGKTLGTVIQYRDFLKKKYIAYGYMCRYKDTIAAPILKDDEQRMKIAWMEANDAIAMLESEIKELKNSGPRSHPGDIYQSKLYNREMSLAYLKHAFKK